MNDIEKSIAQSEHINDRILTKEDYPDILGEWMWESEYNMWKEFCDKQREQFEDFIYGRLQ